MGIGIYEIFVILLLFEIIFWIVAFVNIMRNKFTGYNKLIWLLVVTFVPLIGPIVYFVMGKKYKVKRD